MRYFYIFYSFYYIIEFFFILVYLYYLVFSGFELLFKFCYLFICYYVNCLIYFFVYKICKNRIICWMDFLKGFFVNLYIQIYYSLGGIIIIVLFYRLLSIVKLLIQNVLFLFLVKYDYKLKV